MNLYEKSYKILEFPVQNFLNILKNKINTNIVKNKH